MAVNIFKKTKWKLIKELIIKTQKKLKKKLENLENLTYENLEKLTYNENF